MATNKQRPSSLDASKIIGQQFGQSHYQVDYRDAIIHAVSLGMNEKPLSQKYLKYVYQGHQNFTILPTFSSIVHCLAFEILFSNQNMPIPKKRITLISQVRAQYRSPIQLNKEYRSITHCIGVQFIRKVPQIILKTNTYEKNDRNKISFITYFKIAIPGIEISAARGASFGYSPFSMKSRKTLKSNLLQQHIDFQITAGQPILYRMNRKTSNVHIDPLVANKYEFEQPILHGQSLIDYCIKHIIIECLQWQQERLKMYESKMLRTSYPGKLKLKLWKSTDCCWFELMPKQQDQNLTILVGYCEYEMKVNPKL